MRKSGPVISIINIFLVLAFELPAQNIWTLRDCIEYARQENIQVKRSQLLEESYEVDILQAKAALFPNLSGGISQGFANRKVANENGSYHYHGSFTGDYSLSTSVTLFNGKRNLYNIKEARLQKEAQELNTMEIQNDVEISITEAYLQMLYARESIRNNENILESSAVQLEQSQNFLDVGLITLSEYAQVESQYASDQYNLVLSQTAFENYKLQLKQLLELDYNADFEVAFPAISDEEVLELIPSKYEIYRTALLIMPEVESSRLGLEIANVNISSAKAGYLPTISLGGSIGTGNIYNESPSFPSQLGRNFAQSVSISLNIPIFDNRQNKSNVERAKINALTARLNMLDTEKTLWREIENLYQDAVSSQSRYLAAREKLNAAELSYTLVQEQYSLGLRNTVELTTEKNSYANALQDLLQAKYSAVLSLKLLNFYRGLEITL